MKEIVVVGSGGHAKVIIDILHSMNCYKIIGITSNSLVQGDSFNDYPILGDDSILTNYDIDKYQVAMGLGGFTDNILRQKVYNYIKGLGFKFINVIHPLAIVSRTVKLGESVVVFPGVTLNTDVIVGNNSIIATGSTIDHETIIGNNVLISAGVTIGAYSKINDNSLIALGAKVISGITIGGNSLVAAGAVVVKDVKDNEKVFGIPAAPKKSIRR